MKAVLTHFLIWLPAVLGGLFSAVVKLDHWLFQNGKISPRGAIGIEFVYLAFCAFGFLVSAGIGIQLLKERKPWGIACAVVSIIIGLILLGVGFQQGAAILFAT